MARQKRRDRRKRHRAPTPNESLTFEEFVNEYRRREKKPSLEHFVHRARQQRAQAAAKANPSNPSIADAGAPLGSLRRGSPAGGNPDGDLDEPAPSAYAIGRSGLRCYQCGEIGHFARDCINTKNRYNDAWRNDRSSRRGYDSYHPRDSRSPRRYRPESRSGSPHGDYESRYRPDSRNPRRGYDSYNRCDSRSPRRGYESRYQPESRSPRRDYVSRYRRDYGGLRNDYDAYEPRFDRNYNSHRYDSRSPDPYAGPLTAAPDEGLLHKSSPQNFNRGLPTHSKHGGSDQVYVTRSPFNASDGASSPQYSIRSRDSYDLMLLDPDSCMDEQATAPEDSHADGEDVAADRPRKSTYYPTLTDKIMAVPHPTICNEGDNYRDYMPISLEALKAEAKDYGMPIVYREAAGHEQLARWIACLRDVSVWGEQDRKHMIRKMFKTVKIPPGKYAQDRMLVTTFWMCGIVRAAGLVGLKLNEAKEKVAMQGFETTMVNSVFDAAWTLVTKQYVEKTI